MSKRREIRCVSIAAFAMTLLAGAAFAQQVFVYPKKGQSADQQARDQARGAERNGYERAFAACMESRDYTVR